MSNLTSRALVLINVTDGEPQPPTYARKDVAYVTAPGIAIGSVLDNDVYAGPVTLTPATTVPPELTFDTTTGEVSLNPGAVYGTYEFNYWLCPAGRFPPDTACSMTVVTVRYVDKIRCVRVARAVYDPC